MSFEKGDLSLPTVLKLSQRLKSLWLEKGFSDDLVR